MSYAYDNDGKTISLKNDHIGILQKDIIDNKYYTTIILQNYFFVMNTKNIILDVIFKDFEELSITLKKGED